MNDTERDYWDAIVIGSGIGGMTAAAALSRVGHKVLLLEQHWTLGGLTHSFSRDGFTWDVGVHYLSGLAPGDRTRELLDWLSETPIDLAPIGSIYDTIHIGTAEPLSLSRPYEAQARDLKDRFPDEAEAIDAWTIALKEGRDAALKVTATRAMPGFVGTALKWWHSHDIERWCTRTTQEVIDEITDNPVLAAAFAAQWFDHGGRPSKASFAMHALVTGGYLQSGAWYPKGGGAAFADPPGVDSRRSARDPQDPTLSQPHQPPVGTEIARPKPVEVDSRGQRPAPVITPVPSRKMFALGKDLVHQRGHPPARRVEHGDHGVLDQRLAGDQLDAVAGPVRLGGTLALRGEQVVGKAVALDGGIRRQRPRSVPPCCFSAGKSI